MWIIVGFSCRVSRSKCSNSAFAAATVNLGTITSGRPIHMRNASRLYPAR